MKGGIGRAVVTGGAGFIGSHLVDAMLARGWFVTALDDLSTGSHRNIRHLLDDKRFELVEGDAADRNTVAPLIVGADVVMHLAASVGVQLVVDRPLSSLLNNIRGTEVVLEAAGQNRAKVLLTSTSEIYGKSNNGPFKEDDDRLLGSPRKLRWSYSTSKAVDEILAYLYHKELGLPTVVARLFNTVGPRQSAHYGMVLPRFVAQALRGEPLTVYGDGSQSRSFTYVDDAVEALIRLVEEPGAEGEVFNVAGHEEITMRELAERVIKRTGSASGIVNVPYNDVYGDGFEDLNRRAADTSKLERITGFRCETTIDEAIDRVVQFTEESLRSTA